MACRLTSFAEIANAALVIPGRRAAANPESTLFAAPPSGFRVRVLRTRPGMTGQSQRYFVLGEDRNGG
jgi:hypothetical protein